MMRDIFKKAKVRENAPSTLAGARWLPLLFFMFSVMAGSGAEAAVWLYQGLSLPVSYPTIQAAVNAAANGDRIELDSGIYTGTGNRMINPQGKKIVIRSRAGAAETIIDLGGSGTGFIINIGGAGATIEGLTIRNGGGYLTNASEGLGLYGGAFYIQDLGAGESPTITNCIIINNKAGHGGGIYSQNASPKITNTKFINNFSYTSGGAIKFTIGGTPSVADSTFNGNRAKVNGGAIHSTVSVDIASSTFSENNAVTLGGALFLEADHNVTNSIFLGNTATSTKGSGGAIRVGASAPGGVISHSAFYKNSASLNGGALTVAGTSTLTNSILWQNSAPSGAQVAVTELPTDPDFWTGTQTLYIEQSNIQGGMEAVLVNGTLNGGGFNIDADPKFAVEGSLRLLPDSPCIDAGSMSPVGGLPTADLEGNLRSLDGDGDSLSMPDMGPYEFTPGVPIAAVGPNQLYFRGFEGVRVPDEQPIFIRNSGAGILSFQAEVWPDSQPLLRAEPLTGNSSGNTVSIEIHLDQERWESLGTGIHYMYVNILDAGDGVTVLESIPVIIQKNRIIHVHPTGGDFQTIEEAVSDAVDGDVVLVDDGVYNEGGNVSVDSKTITIRSVNGPETTILDAQSSGRVIEFLGAGNESILQGFTIKDGQALSGVDGGGVFIDSEASPTVVNCRFTSNFAEGRGGAIYSEGAGVVVRNCEFDGNTAVTEGGAIFIEASGDGSIIDSSNFVGNGSYAAWVTDTGGAIYNRGEEVIINDCTFSGNTVDGQGGAVFLGNTATNNKVLNSIFIANTSVQQGGGFFDQSSGAQVVNSIFAENQATSGLQGYGGAVYAPNGSSIVNCSFYNNSSGAAGNDSLYISGGEMINSVFWQASGTAVDYVSTVVSNCASSDWSVAFGEGNLPLAANPFVYPASPAWDFRLQPSSGLLDKGKTINWLFSDQRGSLRPINSTEDVVSKFDIGAMEHSSFYGGIQGDGVAKAFSELRVESSSVAIGYGYAIEWKDRAPFPLEDIRVQQADEYTINLALVNSSGLRKELGTVTRKVSQHGYSFPYIFSSDHIGQWRIRLELASDPNQYLLSDFITIEYKELDAYYYGTQIPAPEGADPSLKPDFTDDGTVFWSEVTNRLYAIGGPKTTVLTWYADEERTIPIPTVAYVTFPPDSTIHVAGSAPVPLLEDGSPFDSVELKFADNDAEITASLFSASTEGWAVLLFRDNEGLTPDEKEVFEVVRTRDWNDGDSSYAGDVAYPVEEAAAIGSAITDGGHGIDCANGLVYFEESWVDAHGENRSYDRTSREGRIFAVNLDLTGPIVDEENDPLDDLVVIWYEKSETTGICWPYLSKRYTPEWPALTAEYRIYLDDEQGTGPLLPTDYGLAENMVIYNQPDKDLPAFNPNEEHAAFFTAQGSTYAGVFPLRNDINRADTSEPYVLLKFINPFDGMWDMRVWQVLDSQWARPFTYNRVVGSEFTPPYPLNQLVYTPCDQSYPVTANLVLVDKDSKMFSYRVDPADPSRTADIHYFYRLQPGFYYDLDDNKEQDVLDGTCIPWLDGRDGLWDGQPVTVSYDLEWPNPVGRLLVGETLIRPKTQEGDTVGLPEIGAQCSVAILHDDNGIGSSAKLIDPISEYGWPYTAPAADPENLLPAGLEAEYDLGSRRWIFTALPPHIRSRLTYDAVSEELKLRGSFSAEVGEPFLQLNMLSDREIGIVRNATADAVFRTALDNLNNQRKEGEVETGEYKGYTAFPAPHQTTFINPELKALSAGDARGTGYVTLAFNNSVDCPAPTMVNVIKVDCDLYTGDLKVIEADNPFEEKVTIKHNGDFGGNGDIRAFQWMYRNAGGTGDVETPTGPTDGWNLIPPNPVDPTPVVLDGNFHEGALDTVIEGSGEQLLGDKWFSARYYVDGICGAAADSADPGNYSSWTKPQLYEGWLKRVMKSINLFDQKIDDFHLTDVNDLMSMISLIGGPYQDGEDVALSSDPEYLQNLGLIEIYETLLRRGLSLVTGDSDVLNQALLLISNRLADLYMVLGNEAYGDAADPTVAFSTESGEYGIEASSIFNFQNQVDTLLEEELALLRGLDKTRPKPLHNRLAWNFTINDGEVAYQSSYNITDQITEDEDNNSYPDSRDGEINEKDAMVQYPQGHGDAWGYYLLAMKKYYELLKHDLFTWQPGAEDILVGGTPIRVDYRDERKFAVAAAAKARAGAEIVNLTYRDFYTEDPEGQWQGYKDANPDRSWGVDGWSRRAGQGAFFDWVVGNAILPSEYMAEEQVVSTELQVFDLNTLSYTPGAGELEVKVNGQLVGADAYDETSSSRVTFTTPLTAGDVVRFRVVPAYGIEKVDRDSVVELWDIVSSYNSIQAEVDKADAGLNPLGLAKDVIPFDIDPQQVAAGQTHFEQIYGRAVQAMNNAIGVFNHANNSSRLIRGQQDSFADFQRNIENMEADYNNRLIEIFGYPYPDDCGAGKTYTSDECDTSPDLYHYMYIDNSELMGEEGPRVHEFEVNLKDFEVLSSGAILHKDVPVKYHVSTDSRFGIIKPSSWQAERRAPGEIQLTRGELLLARSRFDRARIDYDSLLAQIDAQVELIVAQYGLNENEINVLNRAMNKQISLNTSIKSSRRMQQDYASQSYYATLIGDAIASAFPEEQGTIVGTASGLIVDLFSTQRGMVKMAQFALTEMYKDLSEEQAMAELGYQQSKEILSAETNIELTAARNDFAVKQQLHVLENLVRNEITLRHELYVQAEAMKQAASRYLTVIAKGERILEDRLRFRRQTAAQVQEYRYKDMSFRIFRNDALQKYRAQFDMAAKYVYLAAKAYDFETTLLDYNSMAGQAFMTDIVRQRSIGMMQGGSPLTGSGLADPMKRIWQNFQVLKPQLGINNPQVETNRFSLRQEMMRIRMDSESNDTWRQALESYKVADLWQLDEFRKYCRPFAPEGIPQPGLVIPFSTSVTSGLNFFKWPLGGGDSYYSPTNFATKVRSVGVWFSNYNSVGLTQTPRVYLVPVGEDVLRTPYSSVQEVRSWQVLDQKMPLPFPVVQAELENNPGWIPAVDTIHDEMFGIRKHSDFRAYHDSGFLTSSEMQYDSRLIGRSVWNSKWLLIIPGRNLLYDGEEGLETFIHGPEVLGGIGERTGYGVSDIKLFFETYGYSGN